MRLYRYRSIEKAHRKVLSFECFDVIMGIGKTLGIIGNGFAIRENEPQAFYIEKE